MGCERSSAGSQEITMKQLIAIMQPQSVVEAIHAATYTGSPGDGLIAVSELADIPRIRFGERGDVAL